MAFDTARLIEVRIAHPDGDKRITVRWPTDEEWCEYTQRRQVLIRQLSSVESETEVAGAEEAAAELLSRIRQGEAFEVDKYEAAWLIERLSRARVTGIAREDGGVAVEMDVPGGTVVHHIRVPTVAEIAGYRRAFARLVERRGGRQILRINLRAAGELYDKILQRAEGYAGPVPIIHKAAVIGELLPFLEEEAGLGEV